MPRDILFKPFKFRNLTDKNRISRSNLSGGFDNFDGSGKQVRINWEVTFARGGVGAIVSSYVPMEIHWVVPTKAASFPGEMVRPMRSIFDLPAFP